jgi:esterase/lipase superfamily enzyme
MYQYEARARWLPSNKGILFLYQNNQHFKISLSGRYDVTNFPWQYTADTIYYTDPES